MDSPDYTCDIHLAQCEITDRTAFLKELQEIAQQYAIHIICFNADMLAGRAHAQSAVEHAVRSFQEGTAISNTIEMESILYAAGSRQCNNASSFGVHVGMNNLYVCCYPAPGRELWKHLAHFLQFIGDAEDAIDSEKRTLLMQLFDIPAKELEAVGNKDGIVDLVLERVALLNVLR
jgi:KEOPS complex subunit Cgi121